MHKLGLVLSGGGAKGFAHLGVLQALHENHITFNAYSGTSAGAIVAAFLANNIKPYHAFTELNSKNVFDFGKIHLPIDGFLSLNGLIDSLETLLPFKKIEDCPNELYIAATNLLDGKIEYFNTGNIALSVAASASIPVLFSPTYINNKPYADGGIIDNLPVEPLKNKVQHIVAINISPIQPINELSGIRAIAERSFQLGINAATRENLKSCDVVITPKGMREFDSLSSSAAEQIFEAGYNAVTNQVVEKIKSFL